MKDNRALSGRLHKKAAARFSIAKIGDYYIQFFRYCSVKGKYGAFIERLIAMASSRPIIPPQILSVLACVTDRLEYAKKREQENIPNMLRFPGRS